MSWEHSFLSSEQIRWKRPVYLRSAIFAAAAIAIFGTSRSMFADSPSDPVSASSSAAKNSDAAAKAKPVSKAEKLTQAEALVKESLFYEISGSNEDRDRLLEAARTIAPNYEPAMWQSGHVELNNRWMKIDDVPQFARQSNDLGAYEKQRDKAADTLEGQLNIARWCLNRGLPDQARAHYNQVLQFDADNAEARADLGYRRVGNTWVAKPELDEMVSEAQRLSKALNKWLPRVTAIRSGLVEGQGPGFETAKKQFAEINDSEAMPALEYVFSAVNEECATMLVEKLAQWSELPSTQALVRQAIYSPWDSIRQLAATKLEGRPQEDFVPKLLAAMYTPLEVRTVVFNDRGRLVSREVFAREGRDTWEVVMLDTAYVRVQQPGGNVGETLNRAVNDIRRDTAMKQMLAAMQSANTEELNRRIMTALSIATQKTTLVRPEDWWDWWDNQNETSYVKEKQSTGKYDQRTVYVADQPSPPPPSSMTRVATVTTPRGSVECLAAGTKVSTIRGSMPIEKIRVGDLVLAQNIDTGEIAFKPVLRTTVRLPEPIYTLESSGESLRSTGGHLFWVAGEGWTKARNLRSGQTLHCATGTVQVSLVTESAPERTYNLIVADFSTYFVGPEKILSHDVTERKPTRSIVPGLAKN
jgi:tetratricopeptide (TPR) repeat protein